MFNNNIPTIKFNIDWIPAANLNQTNVKTRKEEETETIKRLPEEGKNGGSQE